MAKSRHDFSPRVLTVYDHPLRPEVVVGERGYLALVFSAQLGGRAEELDGAVATEAASAGYLGLADEVNCLIVGLILELLNF